MVGEPVRQRRERNEAVLFEDWRSVWMVRPGGRAWWLVNSGAETLFRPHVEGWKRL